MPDKLRSKLGDKAEDGIIVGCLKRNQYKIWLIQRKIAIITRHFRIYEDQFPARTWSNDDDVVLESRMEETPTTPREPTNVVVTQDRQPNHDNSSSLVPSSNVHDLLLHHLIL